MISLRDYGHTYQASFSQCVTRKSDMFRVTQDPTGVRMRGSFYGYMSFSGRVSRDRI